MNKLRKYLFESGFSEFIGEKDIFYVDVKKIKHLKIRELYEKLEYYLLVEGYFDIYYPDKLGKNHLVARIYPNDFKIGGFLGGYDFLNDYFVTFSKNTMLYSIKKSKIEKLMENNKFLRLILKRNLEHFPRLVEENYFRSVLTLEEFIAYIIYSHSKDGIYVVENYFTFASLLKCDRSSLYRILDSLENKNIIKKNGKRIEIISFEDLKAIYKEKNKSQVGTFPNYV
ncbi:hypothetical protein PM10SUCC1_02860 [Propionigenium maris DSM 9537]|uniref:cAMP-binding domain of CRP or a regulatory subunit of cAMP-dependent protein kinases n=1 Tax=Propionigenium maris DSM 9537 TaxID=1123000 RepID=A0A9W6GJ95_9FUSO|nr:hypothetical protein [Propionigenium maris]GLI54771.1 hypothetical protein PM10SUCC1_02860 [Propionigenium maris DSM 9537]